MYIPYGMSEVVAGAPPCVRLPHEATLVPKQLKAKEIHRRMRHVQPNIDFVAENANKGNAGTRHRGGGFCRFRIRVDRQFLRLACESTAHRQNLTTR
jgi:hypothetical protein